jgi:hypothetical protein
MAQSDVYASCAEVLQMFLPHKGDVYSLFHGTEGFALRMQAVCAEQCVRLLSFTLND